MAVIVPALLEQDFNALTKRIAAIREIPHLERVQIDVINDTLAQGRTIQPAEIPILPAGINWEMHLMTSDPGNFFSDARRIGCTTVIIQSESCTPEVLARLADELRTIGLVPALGVYPSTSIASVIPIAEIFEQVTLLSVEPGKQGQLMDPNAFSRVHALRNALGSAMHIEIDGGITEHNIADAAMAGADLIVAGSAIFQNVAGSPLHNFLVLQQAME
jgi:ribulose-phosphate 3-epimerase